MAAIFAFADFAGLGLILVVRLHQDGTRPQGSCSRPHPPTQICTAPPVFTPRGFAARFSFRQPYPLWKTYLPLRLRRGALRLVPDLHGGGEEKGRTHYPRLG